MPVVIHYDSGHDTRLDKHPRLESLLTQLGKPSRIDTSTSGRHTAYWYVSAQSGRRTYVSAMPIEAKFSAFQGERRKIIGLTAQS